MDEEQEGVSSLSLAPPGVEKLLVTLSFGNSLASMRVMQKSLLRVHQADPNHQPTTGGSIHNGDCLRIDILDGQLTLEVLQQLRRHFGLIRQLTVVVRSSHLIYPLQQVELLTRLICDLWGEQLLCLSLYLDAGVMVLPQERNHFPPLWQSIGQRLPRLRSLVLQIRLYAHALLANQVDSIRLDDHHYNVMLNLDQYLRPLVAQQLHYFCFASKISRVPKHDVFTILDSNEVKQSQQLVSIQYADPVTRMQITFIDLEWPENYCRRFSQLFLSQEAIYPVALENFLFRSHFNLVTLTLANIPWTRALNALRYANMERLIDLRFYSFVDHLVPDSTNRGAEPFPTVRSLTLCLIMLPTEKCIVTQAMEQQERSRRLATLAVRFPNLQIIHIILSPTGLTNAHCDKCATREKHVWQSLLTNGLLQDGGLLSLGEVRITAPHIFDSVMTGSDLRRLSRVFRDG